MAKKKDSNPRTVERQPVLCEESTAAIAATSMTYAAQPERPPALAQRKAVPRSMAMRADEMNPTVLSSLVAQRDSALQRWLQGAP